MDVLVRSRVTSTGSPDARAPWQTRLAHLPPAPTAGRSVAPIAIPVIGGRPIGGRPLVRAPWAEPLAAFAGVVVGTHEIPDTWLQPRPATRRAMDPPAAAFAPVPSEVAVRPARPADLPAPVVRRQVDGLVAIPIVVASAAARPARPAPAAPPVRVAPFALPLPVAIGAARPAPAPAPLPVAAVPAPVPARRGFLARAVMVTVGLVMSLVAFEAANRMGRR